MKIFVCSILLFAIFGGFLSLPLGPLEEKPMLSGPEIAALLKNGTRVVSGKDWQRDNQDGREGGLGTAVADLDSGELINVKWDDDVDLDEYRMGFEGKYDLQLASQPATQTKSRNYPRLG